MLTKGDRVKKDQEYADVICEWPLISCTVILYLIHSRTDIGFKEQKENTSSDQKP